VAVTVGALGVVFGDIGTSPIYTIQTIFNPNDPHPVVATTDSVYGLLSIIIWSVTIVVTIKYVTLVLRADNEGEGGILALITLIRKQGSTGGRRTTAVVADRADRRRRTRHGPLAEGPLRRDITDHCRRGRVLRPAPGAHSHRRLPDHGVGLGQGVVGGVTGDAPGTQYLTARTLSVQPVDCQGVGSGPGTSVQCAHQAISQEVVRTLVGSIGLVLSVPLTTAVGVALVRFARTPSARPPLAARDRPWTEAVVVSDNRSPG
jgi:hypothetical protein